MRCSKSRKRIQQWFDAPGVSTLPGDIADHVKTCNDCRTLITRWNLIELKLQAMREEGPDISGDFTTRLRSRLRSEDFRSRHLSWPMMPIWRYAIAGMGFAVVLLVILYTVFSSRPSGVGQPTPDMLGTIQPAPDNTPANAHR